MERLRGSFDFGPEAKAFTIAPDAEFSHDCSVYLLLVYESSPR